MQFPSSIVQREPTRRSLLVVEPPITFPRNVIDQNNSKCSAVSESLLQGLHEAVERSWRCFFLEESGAVRSGEDRFALGEGVFDCISISSLSFGKTMSTGPQMTQEGRWQLR